MTTYMLNHFLTLSPKKDKEPLLGKMQKSRPMNEDQSQFFGADVWAKFGEKLYKSHCHVPVSRGYAFAIFCFRYI